MALYILFRFHDSVLIDTLDREFDDDLDALDGASALCGEHTIEVYDAGRFVARIKRGDEPLHVQDGPRREAAVTGERSHTEQVVTEARSRVETASQLTQERQRQSAVTLSQSSDVCRHSRKIIQQSNETLTRLNDKGSSIWVPDASRKKPTR